MPAAALDPETRRYLTGSYPRNHNYRVVAGRLWPSWRLWKRDRRIWPLLPNGAASLLDLSCSKGWFVLQALRRHGFERALGIDVHRPDLEATEAVRQHLLPANPALEHLKLEPWRLGDLEHRIADLGGPYDVALCINLYHYLALGSRRLPEVSGTHEGIFEQLAKVCGGTLVFSNCVSLDQLPRHMAERARELGLAETYTSERIRAAASRWFDVQDHGRLGKRPLWTMVRRRDAARES